MVSQVTHRETDLRDARIVSPNANDVGTEILSLRKMVEQLLESKMASLEVLPVERKTKGERLGNEKDASGNKVTDVVMLWVQNEGME